MSAESVPAQPEALADLLAMVARGDRVVITDAAGRPVAVLLPFDVAAELERWREEGEDAAAIDAALAEQADEPPTPHADVLAALGLPA